MFAIAIGANAGKSGQSDNSIVINASASEIDGTQSNSLYIAPIRNDNISANGGLQYDNTTHEVTYNSNKSFIIEHPKDETKYLVHVCLEGPEVGVYYRGEGKITNDESVVIKLPDYVESLACDFSVQITPIYDGKLKHYNTSRVVNNQFCVYGENGEFFWIVHGKRNNDVFHAEPYKKEVDVKGNGPYKWI